MPKPKKIKKHPNGQVVAMLNHTKPGPMTDKKKEQNKSYCRRKRR